MQCADVGMIQRGDSSRLALEAVGELLLGDLDGDRAVQPRVARSVHVAHAAGADGREDLVRTELGSIGKGHRVSNDCTLPWLARSGSRGTRADLGSTPQCYRPTPRR